MKKFIVVLVVTFLVVMGGIAWGNEDIPAQFVVQGIVENGNRYEQITGKCFPTNKGNTLQCKFESVYIRLKSLPVEKFTPQEYIQKFEKETKELCDAMNTDEIQSMRNNMNDYEKEKVSLIDLLCKKSINAVEFFQKNEEIEQNKCTAASTSWEAEFTKNSQGDYEYSSISDLFMTGIKKAVLHTISKDKEMKGSFAWNFSIEVTYMGMPVDGKPLPEPYKEMYSWEKISPVTLPCKYLSLEIL